MDVLVRRNNQLQVELSDAEGDYRSLLAEWNTLKAERDKLAAKFVDNVKCHRRDLSQN